MKVTNDPKIGKIFRLCMFLTDLLGSFVSALTVESGKLEVMDAEFTPVQDDTADTGSIILSVW